MSENGAALFLPQGSFPEVPGRARPGVGCDVIEFGRRYRDIVDALRLTSREVEAEVICFAGLSIDEAAHELGVPPAKAQLAKLREYSELVRIVDEQDADQAPAVQGSAPAWSFCRPAGGHHLVTATADRAESLRTLRTVWKRTWGNPIIIGLCGSDEDVTWLRHVNIAVIVDHGQANITARVRSALPSARSARAAGLRGWSEAVCESVGGLLSSAAGDRPRRRGQSLPPEDERNQEWRKAMQRIQRDFFSRTSMTTIGLLLVAVIATTAYMLREVAVERWFG